MDLNLDNKIALVTGGASGIGKQAALDLTAEGAYVSIIDINLEGAEKVAKEINDITEGIAIKCDVKSTEQVQNAVNKTMDKFGRIDILILNAGIIRDAMVHKMKEEDYDIVLDINLKGYWRFCREIVPIMKKQKYGKIVMISSMAYKGNRGQSNYSPAKAGVVALAKTIAQEVGYLGITSNAIAPGLVETALTKDFVENPDLRKKVENNLVLKRQEEVGPKLGTTKDISNGILFYSSDISSYITGDVMHIAAGRKM
ncbi:MAG: SDR family oxidoreductase [Candidatus Lokiarchaeota archaeon]|nr:SDR family oxidoreductase [Candidatus Lokiarchaeota archaeon]